MKLAAVPERAAGQLQSEQRPSSHVHAGGTGVSRMGPQRLTHGTAVGSIRSSDPPGQERRWSALKSASPSAGVRVAIASTIAESSA